MLNGMFENLPLQPGHFLLPGEPLLPLWPVVACDQYTSQKEKWEEADRIVGSMPSALRLILPECDLAQSDVKVPAICAEMEKYLREKVLSRQVNGMILTERTISTGVRAGLVCTVDLEEYSYEKESVTPIRPTEGTVKERIPPRLLVRKDAALELSHILILINDPENTVLGPLMNKKEQLPLLYDQDLILSGGHLKGYAVEKDEDLRNVFSAFSALKARTVHNGILLAVGDGNHSLATAKAHWERVKEGLSKEEKETHPARFAMVEINNIYDDALVFEPIHRVVFGMDEKELMESLFAAEPYDTKADPDAVIVSRGRDRPIRFGKPLHTLSVGTVQLLLDRAGAQIDYVHGEAAVRSIVAREEHSTGILLFAMPKDRLFPSVEQDGPLPRKTFSMGEANEKRYYMEARLIR